ncbi:MAG: hypothetical protein KKD25_08615 [Gammaproteobacteria bacterium]|jgi:hypothetical protein|nr:hypothetical protein [Gammaproteobacteria bacterium]MBU0772486.1 hypothetical protein [Gammaproteobacteria bacterium]MBU0855031.1 hypothetical protein [Gammaproteobacteria bacterium]MBU1847220.1 hypothetical protein [Gammaproteobacteria bacterium]
MSAHTTLDAPAHPPGHRRDFPGRRWLLVALRSLHLVGVVLVGAALLHGGSDGSHRIAAIALLFGTGLSLYGIELWTKPRHAVELAGLFIPLKLVVVATMAAMPERAAALFWLLLVCSSVVSHAPAAFRHLRFDRH